MKIHELPSSIDLSKCILWQYQNATRLQQLIQMMQDGTEMASVDLWKKAISIFDLDRPISVGDDDYQFRLYGLQSLSNLFGLKRPSWTNGGVSTLVSADTWRRYLKGMIWLMDSDGSCEDINIWLKTIFPSRKAYVVDNLNMSLTYKFFPAPSSGEEDWELVHIDGFLPHPAGVLATANLTNTDAILGLNSQVGTAYTSDIDFKQLDESRFGHVSGTDTARCSYLGYNCVMTKISYEGEEPYFTGENPHCVLQYVGEGQEHPFWYFSLLIGGSWYDCASSESEVVTPDDTTIVLYDTVDQTRVIITRAIE